MKFKITCEQAAKICDKSQYKESTFIEKMKLNIHLLACKFCFLYVKQNRKMTQIFKQKAAGSKNEINCLSAKGIAELKNAFKNETQKN